MAKIEEAKGLCLCKCASGNGLQLVGSQVPETPESLTVSRRSLSKQFQEVFPVITFMRRHELHSHKSKPTPRMKRSHTHKCVNFRQYSQPSMPTSVMLLPVRFLEEQNKAKLSGTADASVAQLIHFFPVKKRVIISITITRQGRTMEGKQKRETKTKTYNNFKAERPYNQPLVTTVMLLKSRFLHRKNHATVYYFRVLWERVIQSMS